ncbi:hypothetical protein GmHk_02G004837 [Glycine max]|nr:hypothetical protein GmHk_02G004837 [Glycine max]
MLCSVKKEKRKFWIALSCEEIKEDIFVMTSPKPARRPRKQPKNVQKQMHSVFLGLWLVGITADAYRVTDTPAKAIYVFGVGIPLFNHNVGSTHTIKWSLWIIHKLLLAATYGFILSANFSKWREKLPPRPSFHNYVAVMFVFSVITLFAYGLAEIDAGLNNWLYDLTMLCYPSVINTNAISLVDNAYYFALGILR